MRELKEETGIKLKLSDVNSSPYVDVSQTDNLNPHKGMWLCQTDSINRKPLNVVINAQ